MSISDVRTAHDHEEVAAVQDVTVLKSREWRAISPDDPSQDGSDA
ncbi:hypothetical protein ACH427_28175 [Streptomyces sp. NPDC020379]